MCIKGRATPWEMRTINKRSERAKELFILMLLPFQGEILVCNLSQGVALGYMLVGPSGRRLADNNKTKKIFAVDKKNCPWNVRRQHCSHLLEIIIVQIAS